MSWIPLVLRNLAHISCEMLDILHAGYRYFFSSGISICKIEEQPSLRALSFSYFFLFLFRFCFIFFIFRNL